MLGLLSLESFQLLCCDPHLVLSNLVESLKLSQQVAHGWLGINIKYLKSFVMVNKSYKTLGIYRYILLTPNIKTSALGVSPGSTREVASQNYNSKYSGL